VVKAFVILGMTLISIVCFAKMKSSTSYSATSVESIVVSQVDCLFSAACGGTPRIALRGSCVRLSLLRGARQVTSESSAGKGSKLLLLGCLVEPCALVKSGSLGVSCPRRLTSGLGASDTRLPGFWRTCTDY
jgi:hypothetical protein